MDKIKYKKLGAGYYKVFIHRIHVADVSKINDGNEIHWELESTIQGKRRTSNPSTTSKILGGWKNWSSSRKSILHKYFERFIYKPNAFNDVIDAKFNGKGIVFGNDSIASLKGNGAKIGEKKSTTEKTFKLRKQLNNIP